MGGLIEWAGKRWGLIDAIIAALPKATRVSAQRISDWVRTGKLAARRLHGGRGRPAIVVALEDVLAVERETRQTAARRGGAKRGHTRPATA